MALGSSLGKYQSLTDIERNRRGEAVFGLSGGQVYLGPPCQTPHYAGLAVHVDCGVDAERCGSTSLLSVAGAVKPLRSFEPILSTQGALGRLTI